jgi:hypothetical protein
MTLPLPAVYAPQLSAQRLQVVADWLLEEFYATLDDLIRPTDTPYTKGCTTFGRQRSRVIAEWRSGEHSWLGMLDAGNAIVFTIGGVPCRFSNDDPNNPSKAAVLEANPYQRSFAEFISADKPERYCFVIDRGVDGLAEPYVALLGYSVDNALMCRWVSDSVTAFGIEMGIEPRAVDVPKAKLGPKKPEVDDKQLRAANDDAPEQP